jgi:hypothetical protein
MNRTLKPLPLAVFDAAFIEPWGDPRPGPPGREDWGYSEYTRTEHDGQIYRLTRVVMPTGARRRMARQYNGYCEDVADIVPIENAMRFDCAWSLVDIVSTFDSFAVTLTGKRRDNGPWPIVEIRYVATGVTEWVPEGNLA